MTSTQDQRTPTQTPGPQPRPREKIYLSHKPGGVWWDDPRIVERLGFSFTSTYEPYVTNWSNCPPTQRDVMFEYFQGASATPYQLFLASKKKGDKFINPRSEEVDAEYERMKAMLDAGEITIDEFYLKAVGGFNKKK